MTAFGDFECNDVSPIYKPSVVLLRILRPKAFVRIQQVRQYQTGDEHNKRTNSYEDAKITIKMAKRDHEDNASSNRHPIKDFIESSFGHQLLPATCLSDMANFVS